ncbi:MAG: HAD family phosphatase [Hungatella sp.]|nr:HAD family phosphatase [Hungatella sp.]
MIKLIASDIDGTLVSDGDNRLNPEIFETVLKLKEKGIQFAAASGRQWVSIERLFEPVKERVFYLSDNGAYVGCHGRNLFLNTIDRGLAMEMVEDIKKEPGLEVMLSGPDVVYMDTKDQEFVDWIIEGYKFQVKMVEDVRKVDDRFIKVSAYKKHGVQEATEEIRKKYEARLKVTISGDMWMDCMAMGVCKGQAIEVLQKGLEIKPEETMAFGDQLNDMEMLERAYYSFAVGNARPEIKAAARFQADTNRNDGVLKILKMLL